MTAFSTDPLPPPQRPAPRSRWGLAFARTVTALILREMASRYGRSPGGYVWALLEPLGMILILSFGFSLLMKSPSLGTSFVLFYATGYLPFVYFQSTTRFAGAALRYSRALLMYPAVGWFDCVFARVVLNTLTSLLVSYLLLTGILIFTDTRVQIDLRPILEAYILAGLLGTGVGLMNCFIIGFVPVWQSVWSIITRPLFLASGIIILYEEMPALAQGILWWNPLIHVTAIARSGFYSMYDPAFVSHVFVLGVGLALTAFGLLFMRQHHAEILTRS